MFILFRKRTYGQIFLFQHISQEFLVHVFSPLMLLKRKMRDTTWVVTSAIKKTMRVSRNLDFGQNLHCILREIKLVYLKNV